MVRIPKRSPKALLPFHHWLRVGTLKASDDGALVGTTFFESETELTSDEKASEVVVIKAKKRDPRWRAFLRPV
jgi:hypothetical protein